MCKTNNLQEKQKIIVLTTSNETYIILFLKVLTKMFEQ